ncbi:MAG: divalent cation tolerance protein CutA, partial [Hyphomicrobium sp.]
SEAVMIIKTRQSLAERVVEAGKALHSYSNPAFVVVPIIDGSHDYIRWLMNETQAPDLDPEAWQD